MADVREHSYIVGFVIVILSLFSFIQTTVILIVIFSYKDLFRSSYHVLIGNLMIADFIVSIMGLFFRGPGLINDSYAEGSFLSSLCDIVPFLTWTALYGSSLAVLCITYNRMLALTNPLKYKVNITMGNSAKLVLITWLSVIVYFVVALVVFHTKVVDPRVQFMDGCFFDSGAGGKQFILVCDTIFFVCPLLGILLMYYRIVRVMRKERLALQHRAAHYRIREAVFRNISLLLLFFTMSWCPNYVIEVKVVFFPTDSERNLTVEDIAVIMFYSNLILDPLVYVLGSSDFRGRVFDKLKLRLKIRRTSDEVTTPRKISQASSRVSPRTANVSKDPLSSNSQTISKDPLGMISFLSPTKRRL
ncbi:hypothetical protein ACHWQZ_G000104 [Mnemiopsis leidyi]